MDENKMIAAEKMYNTICKALETKKLEYRKNDNDQALYVTLKDETKSFECEFRIDAEQETVKLLCFLPDKFDIDKTVDGAVACCVLTHSIDKCSFEMDLKTGIVVFKTVNSYKDSVLGTGAISEMVDYALSTISNSYRNLSALSKGNMRLLEFVVSNT